MKEGTAVGITPYAAALRDYLAGAGEAALHRAYELGRRGMQEGLGVFDVLALHQEALETILKETPAERTGKTAIDAGVFLAESLSPFEMTHRGFREAVAALRHLNQALEESARRIAHALHDEAGQLLVSAHLALQMLSGELPPAARGRLAEVRRPLEEIEKHLRRLSHELRPTLLDDLGLLPALQYLGQGVTERGGPEVRVEGGGEARLPEAIETALYRVVQEALSNVVRHAAARRVRVILETGPRAIACRISDDGQGFDVEAVLSRKGRGGLGVIGMRERINALDGTFALDSAPGKGTEITITIPLEGHHADSGSAGG
ncbi:MAG: ATP-binding protein [Candidatus Polarisedimenticolia bacterium]